MRDKQIENDRLGQQQDRISNDLTMHQDLIQVKDDTIVRLTNQLHEMELQHVMNTSVPPSPGGPFSPMPKSTPIVNKLNIHPKVSALRTSSNGLSFDSDKGEFKEFVDVGVQTSQKASMVTFLVATKEIDTLPFDVVYTRETTLVYTKIPQATNMSRIDKKVCFFVTKKKMSYITQQTVVLTFRDLPRRCSSRV